MKYYYKYRLSSESVKFVIFAFFFSMTAIFNWASWESTGEQISFMVDQFHQVSQRAVTQSQHTQY